MEKNLPVTYKSQHLEDSKISNADCGPASLAMCLEFLGKPHTTGEVLAKIGNPTGFTTIPQLTKVAQDLGFDVTSKVDATFQQIKEYIDKNLPVIVVGGYGYLNSTQDKEFKSSHIMVVVGYREDDSVYVNDPNFWGQYLQDGDHHVYTFEEFNNFWRNEGNTENNAFNILMVVSPKAVEPTPQKVKVTADKGLNGRSEPKTSSSVVTVFAKGTLLDVVTATTGDEVSGNNKWYQVTSDKVFVWSGGVEAVKVEKPKEEKPKEVKEDKDKIIKELQKENKQLKDTIKELAKLTEASYKIISSPVSEPSQSALETLKGLLRI